MHEQNIAIPTADGHIPSFAVHPDGDGPFPAVILYMDAPGIREELRDFSRRIAAEGYYVLLPDMYYRLGTVRINRQRNSPEDRREMMAAMNTLNIPVVMQDTSAMLDFLKTESAAADGPKGCIGYCMSGQYVVAAAATYPDDFAASASLYGVRIVTDEPDSPHLSVANISGELYLGFAENDEHVPDDVIPTLQAALDEHGVSYQLDIWPGTEHGFCFPQRDKYNESAAEKVWERVFDLYRRRLG